MRWDLIQNVSAWGIILYAAAHLNEEIKNQQQMARSRAKNQQLMARKKKRPNKKKESNEDAPTRITKPPDIKKCIELAEAKSSDGFRTALRQALVRYHPDKTGTRTPETDLSIECFNSYGKNDEKTLTFLKKAFSSFFKTKQASSSLPHKAPTNVRPNVMQYLVQPSAP